MKKVLLGVHAAVVNGTNDTRRLALKSGGGIRANVINGGGGLHELD